MPGENKKRLPWGQEKLKRAGYKITTGRETVLRILAESEKHLSAEEIYIKAHAADPAIGMTSVYRTLDILEEMALVNKFDFGDGRTRYELTEGPEGIRHHHHLVCTGCNRVTDYTDFINEEVKLLTKTEKVLTKKYNFKISRHFIQFYGLCEDCCGGKSD
jgi:Fur family ferric uptake transcriptional regulator